MEKYRIIEFNMYGGLQGFGGFDIYVDNTNQPYAYVGFGESIQIKLNSNAHAIIICLSGKYGNSMEPAAIHISNRFLTTSITPSCTLRSQSDGGK